MNTMSQLLRLGCRNGSIEISPSGLDLHFPAPDADINPPGLPEGVFGSAQWMAAGLGKLGGASRSTAKSQAAMENGVGGRADRRWIYVR